MDIREDISRSGSRLRHCLPGCAFVTSLCAGFCISLCVCMPANAKEFHRYLPPSVSEIPVEQKVFQELNAMTVDSGNLFISENIGHEQSITNEFEASTLKIIAQLPQPPSPIHHLYEGVAVGHVEGQRQVYVGGEDVAVYGESSLNNWLYLGDWSGTGTESFNDVTGVAMDESQSSEDWAKGDVFVADGGAHTIDVFRPEAGGKNKYIAQLTGIELGSPFGFITHIAINQITGDLIVSQFSGGGEFVEIWAPELLESYKLLGVIWGPSVGVPFIKIHSIAVDNSGGVAAGNILIADERDIYEFDPSGTLSDVLSGAETEEGVFHSVGGVAVDPESGDVFVGDDLRRGSPPAEGPSVLYKFGPAVVVPDVVTTSLSSLNLDETTHTWRASVSGTVNPDGVGTASCTFAWGESQSFGELAKCNQQVVPNVNSAVPVSAILEGLRPDTTYFYRLQAANGNGENLGEESQDQEFTTPGPGLFEESVAHVTSSSARLQATVNPNHRPSSYQFEYDTRAYTPGEGHHGESVPLAATSVGAGGESIEVRELVQGLAANTTYHYRVVVNSEIEIAPGRFAYEEFDGPDQSFVTQASGAPFQLADGRAWELVSPANKHGGLIIGLNQTGLFEGVAESAASGGALTFLTESPTEIETSGNGMLQTQVLARHSSSGWASQDISLPHATPVGATQLPAYQFFSEDLSSGLTVAHGKDHTLLSDLASEATPYIRQDSSCNAETDSQECFLPIVTGVEGYADVPPGTEFGGEGTVSFVDATPDMRHVLLKSSAALTTEPTEGHSEIYEWSAEKAPVQRLQIVSLLPTDEENASKEEGGVATTALIAAGNSNQSVWRSGHQAMSDDGSRVVWTTETAGTQLYMTDTNRHETLRLDVAQAGAKGGEDGAIFQAMSGGGSRVFFTDTARLTIGSSRVGADLYECTIVEEPSGLKCALNDLTPEGKNGPSEVENMTLGASEDGSYLYFVANGTMGLTDKRGECQAESGSKSCNLYVYHDGRVTFIAALSNEDETDYGLSNLVLHHLGNLTARVSPSGVYLTFMSSRSLTGYDNHDATSGMPDQEVYVYDAEGKRLSCASCNPTDARPTGVDVAEASPLAGFARSRGGAYSPESWVAANLVSGDELNSFGESLYQPRVLSNSGRVFFNSTDALVPGDINGAEDVYEWEPLGEHCAEDSPGFRDTSGGCVGLISSGTAASGAGFLDASASGDDVFFATGTQLVKKDVDGALDVYDAHVCGAGWSCTGEPVETPVCTSPEACRTAISPPVGILGAPASATFKGAGNVGSGQVVKPAPKSLTRSQRLLRALATCKKKRARRQRQECERTARKKFGKAVRAQSPPVRNEKKRNSHRAKKGGRR